MLGCVLVAYLFLNFTKHGRYLYAMGGNKEAAKLSGIDVKKYRYLAGMITAVFIAIGGILAHAVATNIQKRNLIKNRMDDLDLNEEVHEEDEKDHRYGRKENR